MAEVALNGYFQKLVKGAVLDEVDSNGKPHARWQRDSTFAILWFDAESIRAFAARSLMTCSPTHSRDDCVAVFCSGAAAVQDG